jgi:hypothetical protein
MDEDFVKRTTVNGEIDIMYRAPSRGAVSQCVDAGIAPHIGDDGAFTEIQNMGAPFKLKSKA